MERGEQYVAILTEFDQDPSGWRLLSGHSFFSLTSGKIAVEKDSTDAVAREFSGLTPAEAGKLVANTDPRPVVEESLDLGPDARNAAANAGG